MKHKTLSESNICPVCDHDPCICEPGSNHINEVSDKTLVSYLTKVDAETRKHPADPTKRSAAKRNKSVMGFSRALNKLEARPQKEESSPMNFSQFRTALVEKTLTPAEKKKREEVAKAIERENPGMPMGMKMAIATKTAKRVAEENLDEADDKQKALSRALNKLPRKPGTEYDRKVTSYLKKKYNKEEVELEEARGLAGMTMDQLKQEHEKVKSKIESEGKSKMISMNHPLSQRARAIRLHMMIKQKQANEEVEQINELEASTLRSYREKSKASQEKLMKDFYAGDRSKERARKMHTRHFGALRAGQKLIKKADAANRPAPQPEKNPHYVPQGKGEPVSRSGRAYWGEEVKK